MPFKVNAKKNWKLKTDMKLTVSGDEALRKVPSNLHQGLKDSWVEILKTMVLKIKERSPILSTD